jgi:hypothetical protein
MLLSWDVLKMICARWAFAPSFLGKTTPRLTEFDRKKEIFIR